MKQVVKRFTGKAFLAMAAAAVVAASATAQEAPAWKHKSKHGSWDVICNTAEKPEACQAVQVLETRDEKDSNANGQRLLRLIGQKGPEGLVFSFELPFGLDLRPGIVYQIDTAEEAKLPFLTCIPAGCVASTLLSDSLKKQFTTGKAMKIGFRPLGSEKVMVVDVTLDGLDKALAAL